MPENFWKILTFVTLFLSNISSQSVESPLPVVLWHGLGGSSKDMSLIKRCLEENMSGVKVTSLQIGKNQNEDIQNSQSMSLSNQIDFVCNQLKNDASLKNGYNAVGYSQGALLFRGLAQRCPDPPIVNLISLMGPQQGVYGLPNCLPTTIMCDSLRRTITSVVYIGGIQSIYTGGQMWHDPLNEKSYIEKNSFLPDINCDKTKKDEYKRNLLRLKNLVLVKASKDTTIIPKESEWFGFYKSGQASVTYKLEDSPLYKEDSLGLKTLKESGRLHFIEMQGDHVTVDLQWFAKTIIEQYLKAKQL